MSEQLEAGPELDTEVAQVVFDASGPAWISQRGDGTKTLKGVLGGRIVSIPRFSTEMSAAWEVVERLRERGYWYDLTDTRQEDARHAAVFFRDPGGPMRWGEAETASLAICRAALQALDAAAGET